MPPRMAKWKIIGDTALVAGSIATLSLVILFLSTFPQLLGDIELMSSSSSQIERAAMTAITPLTIETLTVIGATPRLLLSKPKSNIEQVELWCSRISTIL